MRLNWIERILINREARRSVLNDSIIPYFRRNLPESVDAHAVEIGCGRGESSRLLVSSLKLARLDSFDLDENEIRKARLALSDQYAHRLHFHVGNGSALGYESGLADVVFGFSVAHHLPDWRNLVMEIERVLKPGGFYCFEEVSREFFRGSLKGFTFRLILKHPYREMFTTQEFKEYLLQRGFRVLKFNDHHARGYFVGLVQKQDTHL